MSCANYLPLISRQLDGELTFSERNEIERHLAGCAGCRATQDLWRRQGTVLRGFLGKAALDESFVRKVRLARESATPTAKPSARWMPGSVVRWAQAIAALAIIAFLVAQFFPGAARYSIATVINPGEGLQVRSSGASAWMPTIAGAQLLAGDWIRNPQASAALIQLRDSSQVTLQQGTLAEIQDGPEDSAGQVLLLRGSVVSEAQSEGRNVQVRTAAGRVAGGNARFEVQVRNLSIPRLMLSDDNSEVLTGSIMPLSGVNVEKGVVRVEAAARTRDVTAGAAAFFTPSQLAVLQDYQRDAQSISVTLKSDPAIIRGGGLVSALLATDAGLHVQVRANGVPLRRLLESTTGEIVVGGEGFRVTGSLAYPVYSRQEDVVAAIGTQLGLPISLKQAVNSRTASLPSRVPLVSEAQPSSEFTIRRSAQGLLSFNFRGVSASQVFRNLRSEDVELPQLAIEDEWIPITAEASNLEPRQVLPWLEKELGMVVRDANSSVRVVHVGTPERGTRAQIPFTSTVDAAPIVAEAQIDSAGLPHSASAAGLPADSSRWWTGARSFDPMVSGGMPNLTLSDGILFGRAPGLGAGTASTASASGRLTGAQRGSRSGSRHITWPVLSSAEIAAFTVTNTSPQRIRTLWNGYDNGGRLVVQQEIVVEANTSLNLVSGRDLPQISADGGHWETVSDSPISGTGDVIIDRDLAAAVESESLPPVWEFDSNRLGSDGRLWFVNPSEEMARFVLAVISGDDAMVSQQVFLAPHMGMLWSFESLLAIHPDLGNVIPGSTIVIQAMEGSIAAGLRANAATTPARGKKGEWVH
jgi:anti-sigma factor RsiW